MFWLSHLEHKGSPLAPTHVFFRRLGRNFLATLGIVAFSLAARRAGITPAAWSGWTVSSTRR